MKKIFFSLFLFFNLNLTNSNKEQLKTLIRAVDKKIEWGDYQQALEKLEILKNKFPYSTEAIQAEKKIANIYYKEKSYLKAAEAYANFCNCYPEDSDAIYFAAKSYFKASPRQPQRDQTSAEKALEFYDLFLKRSSHHSNVQEAAAKKERFITSSKLAAKKLNIAEFYMKRKNYKAAKNRYHEVIFHHPETPEAQKAKEHIKKIDLILGIQKS